MGRASIAANPVTPGAQKHPMGRASIAANLVTSGSLKHRMGRAKICSACFEELPGKPMAVASPRPAESPPCLSCLQRSTGTSLGEAGIVKPTKPRHSSCRQQNHSAPIGPEQQEAWKEPPKCSCAPVLAPLHFPAPPEKRSRKGVLSAPSGTRLKKRVPAFPCLNLTKHWQAWPKRTLRLSEPCKT